MSNTIVVELLGGLGNQLFQYAVGRSAEIQFGYRFFFCTDQFKSYKLWPYQLDLFKIQNRELDDDTRSQFQHLLSASELSRTQRLKERILRTIRARHPVEYREKKNFVFDPKVFSLEKDTYLRGYWQSYKYLDAISDQIRSEFQLKEPPLGRNAELIEIAKNSRVTSLHVRRGDYVSNPSAASFHGTCSPDYYKNAIELIGHREQPEYYFVFSDDISWCRENIRANAELIFVDHNNISKGYEDMRIMSHCSSHVIANSTFSWWGAWLAGSRSKLVIGPKMWTTSLASNELDLYPPNWLAI